MRSALLGCVVAGVMAVMAFASCGSDEPPSGDTPSPATAGPLRCTDDLATARPAVTLFGAEAGDYLADRFSLASGDFNGDGFDDMLVGAPLADGPGNSRPNSGEAYVVFGAPLPAPQTTIDLASDGAGVTLYGENADDNLGFTVAAADVNGDGIDDLLAGARFARAAEKTGAGSVYVVFGERDLPRAVDLRLREEDLRILGIAAGDLLGVALAGGDVNGDGVSDLIMGASGARGPNEDRPSAGAVYVVPGSSGLSGTISLAEAPPFFTVHGASESDNLPNYLASADLDGDGRMELLLGVPFADGDAAQEDAGRAYILDVPHDGGSLDLAEGKGFTQIVGSDTKDGLGFYLTSGDLNGDGEEEVIIGVRDADGPDNEHNNAGEAAILVGGEETNGVLDETNAALVYGIDVGDSLGFTVASGDLNGDGLDDLLLGAPIADGCENARPDAGDIYVRVGTAEIPPVADLAFGHYERLVFGAEAGDELGFSLATGDFNGDGRDDIFAGALLADGPDNQRIDAGEAYVILSGGP
jgi:hypothetical protein